MSLERISDSGNLLTKVWSLKLYKIAAVKSESQVLLSLKLLTADSADSRFPSGLGLFPSVHLAPGPGGGAVTATVAVEREFTRMLACVRPSQYLSHRI